MQSIWAQVIAQRGHLFGWTPVLMAFGVAWYFTLKAEPAVGLCFSLLVVAVIALLSQRVLPDGMRMAVVALAMVVGGFGIAGVRANMVAEPVLGFRYYGPIEGRIIEIDRSASDAVRLTLDRVVLSRLDPRRTPATVRLSLHGDQGYLIPEPGQVVLTTGHLSPPSGPVEPGGFDFQRMAWFEGLGAVGYTRNPVVLGGEASEGAAGLWIYRQRVSISTGVQSRLVGESGAFAAAIMTGDRSGMGQDSLGDLRASNLAHLLAISGMHMGIMAAFVFACVRYGLALFPFVALRVSVKKIAAVAAMIVAAGYLALSGGNVSTERAFIMVSVMLAAVLFDRRALTLRAVAIAALIVLTLRPEALFGPGFQMSFAATTALVAVFSVMRNVHLPRVPAWMKPIGAVFISSLVAGLATAPFAAYHFNQIAQLGLIANLLSVPLMGTLVMPAAVAAAVLAPFGLEMLGLWVMDLGLRWILGVAHFIAAQEGSLRHVITPPPLVLGLIATGGCLAVIWRGSLRWVGLAPLAVGFLLWQFAPRPAILVSESGSLIGVMGEDGRAVSKERGESFAASVWLENDGGPVPQAEAYARQGLTEDGRTVWADIDGTRVLNLRGATALAALDGCGGADIVITNQEAEPRNGCDVYDITRLRETGSLAGWVENGVLRFTSARDLGGTRLWNARSARERGGAIATLIAGLRP